MPVCVAVFSDEWYFKIERYGQAPGMWSLWYIESLPVAGVALVVGRQVDLLVVEV